LTNQRPFLKKHQTRQAYAFVKATKTRGSVGYSVSEEKIF
jgi:hypothetical protein